MSPPSKRSFGSNQALRSAVNLSPSSMSARPTRHPKRVSISRKRTLLSWKTIPGVQPSFLLEDAEILQHAVRIDPKFPEIMRRRGITDLSHVGIGDWPGGYYGDPKESGFRFRRAVFTYRDSNNQSDRPIENLTADVDLNTSKVVRWTDGDVVPIPPAGPGLGSLPAAPTRPLRNR